MPVGVRTAPTQRPGRSGAWKSDPAIGTRPYFEAHSRRRTPSFARTPGPSTSMEPRPPPTSVRRASSRRSKGGWASPATPPAPRMRSIAASQASLGLGTSAGPPSPRYRANASRSSATCPPRTSQSARCRRPIVARGKSLRSAGRSTDIPSVPRRSTIASIRPARASAGRRRPRRARGPGRRGNGRGCGFPGRRTPPSARRHRPARRPLGRPRAGRRRGPRSCRGR